MKKAFLIIALMGSVYADAQTYIADKFIMRKGFVLKNDTVSGVQKDTNFVSDKSVPTSLAVAKFVAGHSAGGGSSTPFLFGINDTVMGQNRYMDMMGVNNIYYDFDGAKAGNNYIKFGENGSPAFDAFFSNGLFFGEIYVDNSTSSLFGHGISSLQQIRADNDAVYLLSGATHLIINNDAATLSRSNDNIAKNIITSVNSQLADVNGNIDIAAGGAPMRFGIEDTTMGQDRYMTMANSKMYFDYDGNKSNSNFINFGYDGNGGSFDAFFSLIDPNTHIQQFSEITTDKAFIDLISSGTSGGQAELIVGDSTISMRTSSAQNANMSTLLMKQNNITIRHSNDNIAKNIITSVNNQLADSTGNINTPTFTIAQRNALPIPSAGFTAFITDATANDTSVGVNQSWNGMTWKNNW